MAKKSKKPAGKKSLKASGSQSPQAEKTFGAYPPNLRGFAASLSKLGRYVLFFTSCILIVVVALSTASALVGSILGVILPLALTSGMAYVPGILAKRFAKLSKRMFDRFLLINIPLTPLLFGLIPFAVGTDLIFHGGSVDWSTTAGLALLLFGGMHALMLISVTLAGYYAREDVERRVFYAMWIVVSAIFLLIIGPWLDSLRIFAGILVLLAGLYGLFRWSLSLGIRSKAWFATSSRILLVFGLGDLFLLLFMLALKLVVDPAFIMIAIAVALTLMGIVVSGVAKIKSWKRFPAVFTLVTLVYYAATVCVYSSLLVVATYLVVLIPLISTSIMIYAPLAYARKNFDKDQILVQRVTTANTAVLFTGFLLLPTSIAIELAAHQIFVPLEGIVAITAFTFVAMASVYYRQSGRQGSPSGRFYVWTKACAGLIALIASLFILRFRVIIYSVIAQSSIINQIAFYIFGGAILAPIAFTYSQLSKKLRQILAGVISFGVAFSISVFTYGVLTIYGPLAAKLDVALGISFDFGILVGFIAINLFRKDVSPSNLKRVRTIWALVPIINFTTMYLLFSPIDRITTPLSLFGIVNISGAWALTVIISTLLYLPIVRNKNRKVIYSFLFVIWGEIVVLLSGLAFSFFAGDTIKAWGFLLMTSIGGMILLAYKANTRKLLPFLLLTFGFVCTVCVPIFLLELGVALLIGVIASLTIFGICILGYTFVPGQHGGTILRISAYFLIVGGIFFLIFLSFLQIPSLEYFGAFVALGIAAGLFHIARRRDLFKVINEHILWVVMAGCMALSISDLVFILWKANVMWLGFTFITIMVAFLYRYLTSSQLVSWVVMPLPVTLFIQGLLSLSTPAPAIVASAWIVTYLTAFLVQANILHGYASRQRKLAQKNVLPQASHVSLTYTTNLVLWSIDTLFISLWVAISSKGTWTNQIMIFGIVFFSVSVIELLIIRKTYPKVGHLLHALGSVLMAIGILTIILESTLTVGVHIWIILDGWMCLQLYTTRVIFSTIRAFMDRSNSKNGAKTKIAPLLRRWEQQFQALITYAILLLFGEYLIGLILPHIHLERIIVGTEVWSQVLVIAIITQFLARLDQRTWKLLSTRTSPLLFLCTWIGILLGLLPWEYALITIALPILPLVIALFLGEVYYMVRLINFIREDKVHEESFRHGFAIALEINFAVWPLYFASPDVKMLIPLIIGSAAIFLGITFVDERVAPTSGKHIRLSVRRISYFVFAGSLTFETYLLLIQNLKAPLFAYSIEFSAIVAILMFVGFCALVTRPFHKHSAQAVLFWLTIWLLLAGIIYFLSWSLIASSIILLAGGIMYTLIFLPSVRELIRDFIKKVVNGIANPFHQIFNALARWANRASKVLREVADKLAAYWRDHSVSLWIMFCIMCGIGTTCLMVINGEFPILNSLSVGLVIFFLFFSGIFPLSRPRQKSNIITFRKKAIYYGGLYWSFSWAILGFFSLNLYVLFGDILLFGGILLRVIHYQENRRIISFKWRFGVSFAYVVLICSIITSILWIFSALEVTLIFLSIVTICLVLFLAMIFKAPPPVIDARFTHVLKDSPYPPAIPNPDVLMQFFANATHTRQLASLRKELSQQQSSYKFLPGIAHALIILLLRNTRALGKVVRNTASIAITIMAVFADIIGFHFEPNELHDFITQKIQSMRDDHLLREKRGKLFLTPQGMSLFKNHAYST